MHIKSPKSITLTELIISTAMIGIVMLGMASVDYAIRQAQITTSKKAQLAMRVGAMLITVAKNAALATGVSSDTGIRINPASPIGTPENNSYACFRQDVNDTAITDIPNSDVNCSNSTLKSRNTPGDFTDDCWICFTLRAAGGGNPPTLYQCTRNNNPALCNGGVGEVLVGSAQSFTVNYNLNTTAASLQNLAEITITSFYDNTTAADPIKNPSYTMTTRVSPGGQSQAYVP